MTTAAQACQLLLQRCEKLDAVDRMHFAHVLRGRFSRFIADRLERYAAFLGLHGVKFSTIQFPHPPAVSPPREDRTISANGVAFLARYGRGDAVADVVIRSLPAARWEPTLRAMRIPGSPAVVEALRGLEQTEGWVFCESADMLCEEVSRRAAERAAGSRSADGRFRIDGLLGELRPYQQAGVEFATKTGTAFIADEMGLGKTVQALGTVQALQAWPAVVVTVASCALQWEDEARKWIDGVRCVHWEGRGTRGQGDKGTSGKEQFDSGGVESRHARRANSNDPSKSEPLIDRLPKPRYVTGLDTRSRSGERHAVNPPVPPSPRPPVPPSPRPPVPPFPCPTRLRRASLRG